MKSLFLVLTIFLGTFFSTCSKEKDDYIQQIKLPALTGNSVRIVSYNLLFEKSVPTQEERRWANRFQVVKGYFTGGSFDIIGTQEALTFQVRQLESFGDYGRIGVDLGSGGTESPVAENEAIFYKKSRFEVLESGNFWFSLMPDKPGSYGWEATYPRMCTWGKFKEKNTGKVFYVFNSHFHVESPMSRLEAAKMVLNRIKEVSGNFPVFCTGDLNDVINSEPIQQLLSDGTLKDSSELAKEKSGPTGTVHGFDVSKEPTRRIDYVLINDKVEALTYRVVDEELKSGHFGSDHFPVVLDAVLK